MSLYHRIRRRFGHDTTIEVTHEMPVYEYEIEHTDGDYSEVLGHGYNVDGAFARFYEYQGVFVWQLGEYHVSASGQHVKRVLESIKEIRKTKVGETELKAVIDKADGAVLEKGLDTGAVE